MKHKIKNMFFENGILNGKRVLATVTTLTILAGTTLSALASGDGIRSDGTPWLSTGDVSYQNANGNQSSLFAREDLDYLDDRITDLENTTNNGKAEVASAINSYGYHKDSAVDSNASYSDLASAIKTSQQIPADRTFSGTKPGETDETSGTISAATADNLSLGTAAWVDGELIVGTGADNNSYYNYGYVDGYKDGQNKTGTVTFEQHHHSSGCYRTCTITHTYDYIGTYDGTIHANEFQRHSTCGLGTVNKGTTCPLTCNTWTSTHTYLVCGYSEGQILSATIVYN